MTMFLYLRLTLHAQVEGRAGQQALDKDKGEEVQSQHPHPVVTTLNVEVGIILIVWVKNLKA